MLLKAALIGLTCSGFVLGFRIDSRVKRQIPGVSAISQGINAGISKIPGIPNQSQIPGLSSLPTGVPQVPSTTAPSDSGDSSSSPEPSGEQNGSGAQGSKSSNPASDLIPSIPSDNPIASEGRFGMGDAVSGIIKTFGSGIGQIAGGIVNKVQTAANKTYEEQANSVKNSFNAVKGLIHKHVETGGNITKTGFDLGTTVPKFFKHIVLS